MTNATQAPWVLEAGRNIKTASGTFYLTYGKDRDGNPTFKNFSELDDNAAYIVQCVNGYDELVEAVRNILPLMRRYAMRSPTLEPSVDILLPRLEHAIAKAEGREQP